MIFFDEANKKNMFKRKLQNHFVFWKTRFFHDILSWKLIASENMIITGVRIKTSKLQDSLVFSQTVFAGNYIIGDE